jgi:hypothetical protein
MRVIKMTDILDDPIKTKFGDIIKYRSNKIQWTRESAYKLGTMESELLRMLQTYFDPNNPRDIELTTKYKRVYDDIKEIYNYIDENVWLKLIKKDEDRILEIISIKLDQMGYLSTSRVFAPTTVHSEWDESDEEKAERKRKKRELLKKERMPISEGSETEEDDSNGI